jgi:HTH-type transcriptional regulator/antitoxin MqsA
MRCSECGGSFVKSNAPVTFEVHGEPVIVDGIEHYVCEGCGNEVYRADMASRLQELANEAYCKDNGFLTGEDIKGIRGRLGVSQERFEEVLRIGRNTVTRWEGGTVVQSGGIDSLLRLVGWSPLAFEFLAGRQCRVAFSNAEPKSTDRASLSFGTTSGGDVGWVAGMSENVLSPFNLVDTQILEFRMCIDAQRIGQRRDEMNLSVTSEYIPIKIDEEGDAGQINLAISFDMYPELKPGRKRKQKAIVSLSVTMRCLVKAIFEQDTPDIDKERMFKANGISFLYGEARTHVAAMTSLSPAGKITLPAISPIIIVENEMADRTARDVAVG